MHFTGIPGDHVQKLCCLPGLAEIRAEGRGHAHGQQARHLEPLSLERLANSNCMPAELPSDIDDCKNHVWKSIKSCRYKGTTFLPLAKPGQTYLRDQMGQYTDTGFEIASGLNDMLMLTTPAPCQ